MPVQADWHAEKKALMGTEISVQLWHEDAEVAQRSISAVFAEMRRIDALMSTYKDTSELSQVNKLALDRAVVVSDELFELIHRALQFSAVTSGAFDITYASVGQHYDFRAGQKPTTAQKRALLASIGIANIELNTVDRSVRFTAAGVRIDLGGIAKGYAVESAVALLQARGIEHAIVTAGGDSRILGDHRGRPWGVGIRDPRNRQQLAAQLPLQDEAISTSGDYERYFEADGIRYHHIIEPATGDSARKVRSVTIIGPDAVMTDALSTGVFVLGVKKGMALVNSLAQIEAVIIDARGVMHFSGGLQTDAVAKL
ncbi:MAG: FAD:protein FMN transferase [Gammaproteobacteria bacterium]|nr:FAD:protein FMN transferase [Gammaproteobacteria bacterium]